MVAETGPWFFPGATPGSHWGEEEEDQVFAMHMMYKTAIKLHLGSYFQPYFSFVYETFCFVKVTNAWEDISQDTWLWGRWRGKVAAPVPLYFLGENQSAPPPCSGFLHPFVHKLLRTQFCPLRVWCFGLD